MTRHVTFPGDEPNGGRWWPITILDPQPRGWPLLHSGRLPATSRRPLREERSTRHDAVPSAAVAWKCSSSVAGFLDMGSLALADARNYIARALVRLPPLSTLAALPSLQSWRFAQAVRRGWQLTPVPRMRRTLELGRRETTGPRRRRCESPKGPIRLPSLLCLRPSSQSSSMPPSASWCSLCCAGNTPESTPRGAS